MTLLSFFHNRQLPSTSSFDDIFCKFLSKQFKLSLKLYAITLNKKGANVNKNKKQTLEIEKVDEIIIQKER